MKTKLYIIHGWTYSIEPWTSVVSILKSKGIEVEQLRVPGLTAKSTKSWDIDGYVQWLSKELKGKSAPVVLGHSNGGRIALNYLKKYPNGISELILLNAAGINVSNRKVSFKRRVFKAAAFLLRPLKYIPLVRKIAYRLIGGSDYDRAPEYMKKTLDNMLQSDKNLDISDIKTPIQILWGANDSTTPLAQGEKMARLLPNARLRVFDGWAHAPYITHPNELAAAIIAALGGKS